MIVREAGASLLLITQPDHAALARRIVEPWRALARADRRASILRAIEEHDNGWREPDSAPIFDPASGRVLDFITAPASIRQAVWPRGVARLADDPWAAALVAEHALTLYERHRGEPEWAGFLLRMAGDRDACLSASGLTLEDLRRDYLFLRAGDLVSLVFCNGWADEHEVGPYRVWLDGSRLVIAPDPYGGRQVPFEIAARELAQHRFTSAAEAREAFAAAPVVRLEGTAVGR